MIDGPPFFITAVIGVNPFRFWLTHSAVFRSATHSLSGTLFCKLQASEELPWFRERPLQMVLDPLRRGHIILLLEG